MRALAKWCFNHRLVVVLTWLAAIAGLNALHSSVGSAYSDNFKLPHTESFDAVRLLQRDAPKASGDTDQVVIATSQGRLTDPATRARVEALLTRVGRLPHVSAVSSPYVTRGTPAISPSGQIGFANVTFDIQPNKIGQPAAKQFD